MFVPIELHCLAQRVGYLSPELALGWRIGAHVRDFFDGLEGVRIAVSFHHDAVFALSTMARRNSAAEVVAPDGARPWDFLFYHALTGTALNFAVVRQQTQLPRRIQALESGLSGTKPRAAEVYRAGLDLLVESVLNRPVAEFSLVREFRYRRLRLGGEPGRQVNCRRCGRLTPAQSLWDRDGEQCCPYCSGLEPAWFEDHPGRGE